MRPQTELAHQSIKLKDKLRGVIQVFRPELPLAAGLCVVLGEFLALGAFPSLGAIGLGFACGFFLSGSALIANDYFDLEVDRINAPERALPSGRLTPSEVMALALVSAFVGLVAAWTFSPLALGVSLVVWAMGFVYNWKLKAAGLWGNLIVSGSVAMTFILGGIVVNQPWNRMVWTFSLIAFFFDLAEEIAGDAMDAEGDRKRASTSIAIMSGKQTAIRISVTLLGFVVLLSFLPLVWGGWVSPYLLTIVPMDIVLIYFALKLLKSQTSAEGRRAMRGLYLSASLGLLAFLLGTFLA